MAAAAPDVDAEAGVAAEAGGVSFAGEDTLLALFFECLALMGGTNGENFPAGCKHRGEWFRTGRRPCPTRDTNSKAGKPG